MKKYDARVQFIGETIEEEVVLLIDGYELTCFASVLPYFIEIGCQYPVTISPFLIDDDYEIEEASASAPAFEKCGDGFQYWITGQLNGVVLECGLEFEDQLLLWDYGDLNGKRIRLKADRLDVEFH
ncbi:hypothetical protein [Roseibium aggregatum]|uniref:Uncharacterized protein n=1 Tax=Roseibium aggregatum TaxID=187304 RepID=A0A926NWL7_9HYPH|nr:hypothetical protein [Roseibium aggregatum]MBD1548712.1 hypothetical protein [Roseibium aggregatum]